MSDTMPDAADREMTGGRITRISGALVEAQPCRGAFLYELARVGDRGMLGEVIRIDGDRATLQVYEDTTGLGLGEGVQLNQTTLVAQLGPGLLGSILDGTGRPLDRLATLSGDFLVPGLRATTLDASARWKFEPAVEPGAVVRGGDILGTVEERIGVVHRILVPPRISGTVARLGRGTFTIDEPIGALVDGTVLRLSHQWPVRLPRPFNARLSGDRPFITGQRVFDFLFPVAEGGSAAVPGGFGTGKTVIEHSLAKFSDADVVVFVGCGERGNEMADVLHEFPRLVDPRTGRSIMDRAVLIVNTSNMPVAAREASIFLGVTVAEYFRDMGYRVAMMVDSISRWAEALREISARLQDMPGEEGFPPYLASRLGRFYERAGRVRVAGSQERDGAVTIISAISPPGGDFSEPVTQAALRVTGALWALDPSLAHQRHFPSVDWGTSYSLYADSCAQWFAAQVAPDWPAVRRDLMTLLQRERELRDVSALVGPEALEPRDRLLMEIAAIVREILLRQNAFHPHDGSSPATKTYALAAAIRELHRTGIRAVDGGAGIEELPLDAVRRALVRLRDAAADEATEAEASVAKAVAAVAPGAKAATAAGSTT
ncbi:MAG: V-type ATP synthase subunit A [Gemmatimonadaceae bacterium]